MDEPTMRSRVAAARLGRLATADESGKPHVVPFCFVLVGDRLFSVVDDKPKRSAALKRLANVRVNPRVCVLVDEYSDDWSRLWWIRIDGRADVIDGAAAGHAVDALAEKYEQYRERRPDGDVLRIAVERWTSWSARS